MARNRNKKTYCLNCNFQFHNHDNFCPQCGQENHDLKISFRHFLDEFLEGLFHFDNKIWTSLKYLFLYPGKITKDYIEGKRIRFVPPMRMYIFFSFVFFLLLNLWFSKVENKDTKVIEMIQAETGNKGDTFNVQNALGSIRIDIDSSKATESSNEVLWKRKLTKLMALNKQEIHEMNMRIYKYMSYGLFLLLPLLAFILKIFYRKSDKYYYEHLIAAIHFEALLYIMLSLVLIFIKIGLSSLGVVFIFFMGIMMYFSISLQRIYQNSWSKSILKACLILLLYFFVLFLLALACSFYVFYNL